MCVSRKIIFLFSLFIKLSFSAQPYLDVYSQAASWPNSEVVYSVATDESGPVVTGVTNPLYKVCGRREQRKCIWGEMGVHRIILVQSHTVFDSLT